MNRMVQTVFVFIIVANRTSGMLPISSAIHGYLLFYGILPAYLDLLVFSH